VRKRRRKKRREPPAARLDERLTSLDLATLEQELQQLLETRSWAPEQPLGEERADPIEFAGVSARERPMRPLDVPEAEVVIIRHDNVARTERHRHAAAEVPPPATIQPAEPLRAPRPVFNGVVEEASVVIIRRPPRERIP
jgi:hypothetical protein